MLVFVVLLGFPCTYFLALSYFFSPIRYSVSFSSTFQYFHIPHHILLLFSLLFSSVFLWLLFIFFSRPAFLHCRISHTILFNVPCPQHPLPLVLFLSLPNLRLFFPLFLQFLFPLSDPPRSPLIFLPRLSSFLSHVPQFFIQFLSF